MWQKPAVSKKALGGLQFGAADTQQFASRCLDPGLSCLSKDPAKCVTIWEEVWAISGSILSAELENLEPIQYFLRFPSLK